MTIIVGIVCRDAIVLACDSQMTQGISKQINPSKISVVQFTNGTALVAESGTATLSAQAVDIIRRKAENTAITSEETVVGVVQQAVREVRNDQVSLFPPRNYSLEEWKRYFADETNFELTLAYYHFDNTPYLYVIDLAECVARKALAHFVASGCGADLGHFLLTEYTEPQMTVDLGMALAIHTVETVIKHNAYCDHPTRMGIIHSPSLQSARAQLFDRSGASRLARYQSEVQLVPQSDIQDLAKLIAGAELEARSDNKEKLLTLLKKHTRDKFEALFAQF